MKKKTDKHTSKEKKDIKQIIERLIGREISSLSLLDGYRLAHRRAIGIVGAPDVGKSQLLASPPLACETKPGLNDPTMRLGHFTRTHKTRAFSPDLGSPLHLTLTLRYNSPY